jgi:hypothetical protein
MLHVLVKTESLGLRKAWYIDAVRCEGRTLALVVFKNNDNDKFFTEVPVSTVCLDTSFRNEAMPVVDSVRSINAKLRSAK